MAEVEDDIGRVGSYLSWIPLGCGPLIVIGGLVLSLTLIAALITAGSSSGDTGGGGTQTASNQIPAVLQPIFSKAANMHNMSVDFLAAIFWQEHGHSFPTMGPWATSGAGAEGPFQFEPATWASHEEDCNGDGIDDVQNLWDASCGAADLLAAIGARGVFDTSSASITSLQNAASIYNSGQPWSVGQGIPQTAAYVPAVISEYERLLSGGG